MSKRDEWEKSCKKFLEGKTIKRVRYMTDDERDEHGWHTGALVIEFKGGGYIYPSADDEGNDAGALFTSEEELMTIPVMYAKEDGT